MKKVIMVVLSAFVTSTCFSGPVKSGDFNTKNDLGMEFVSVEPGSFTAGSGMPKDEAGRDAIGLHTNIAYSESHEIPRLITLTRAFEIQSTEVTQGQWKELFPKWSKYVKEIPSELKGDNQAVYYISWIEVQKFIGKLNKRYNATLDCSSFEKSYKTPGCYRLPTEAEWEFAARSGTRDSYSFGDEFNDLYANYARGNSRCLIGLCNGFSVAQKLPNQWNLYDMHGNLWELVQDTFSYMLPFAPQVDPVFPSSDFPEVILVPNSKVIKGGFNIHYMGAGLGLPVRTPGPVEECWPNNPNRTTPAWGNCVRYMRSASRKEFDFKKAHLFVGFRLARTL